MKLESFLSRLAAAGVFATTIGLVFNALALALFCGAAGALVLLIATSDYAARRSTCTATLVPVPRRRAALPLAA